ncbi:hypothetical protein QTI66_36580 [Variovorax sp. J22R133]|nr:hypothetical protein [Variovorax sp. J22R133]MDM0117629.1 hypothetical protein [Variovorax sp. J22R133]
MNDFKKMKPPEIRRHALSAAALVLCAGTWTSVPKASATAASDRLQST